MATAALYIGIASLIVNLFYIPGVLAIIFGILGLGNSRTTINDLGLPVGRTASIAGIVLGAIGTVGSFAIGSLWQFL